MAQYLITTFTDFTGRKHNHITQARDNQSFKVVEAKSKEEVERKFKEEEK